MVLHIIQALWTVVLMGVLISSLLQTGPASSAATYMFVMVSFRPPIRNEAPENNSLTFAIVLVHDTSSYLLNASSAIPADTNDCTSVLGHGNQLPLRCEYPYPPTSHLTAPYLTVPGEQNSSSGLQPSSPLRVTQTAAFPTATTAKKTKKSKTAVAAPSSPPGLAKLRKPVT